MAKKERNKRAERKARQAKRLEVELVQQAQAASDADAKPAKAGTAAIQKAKPKADAKKKNGFIARVKNYFGEVRSEMRRVVWPSKQDLKSYTVAVVVMLVIFGVAVWLIDTGVVAALVGFSSLRG